MKRFVICMPSRKENAIKELDKLYKNEYEVFDAIKKEKASVGISESFKAIIQANYQEPEIHIFEDDVKFTSVDSRRIFEKNEPCDFDIYLGGSYWYQQKKDFGFAIELNDFASLHSVVIKKKAYDYFLSHDPVKVENIDRWVGQFCKDELRAFVCNPMVAIQYNGHSFNRGRVVNYDSFLLDKPILR